MSSSGISAVTVITQVDFEDELSSEAQKNILEHLTEKVQNAAAGLSLRTVKGVRVLYCGGGIAGE